MKIHKYIFFCLTLLLVTIIIILLTTSKSNYKHIDKHIDNTIVKLIAPEITTQNNIFMVWVGKEPKINYLNQIKNAIYSFKYHNPNHNSYLFSNIISQNDVDCKVLPINLDEFLYKNTPLENFDFEPLDESFGKSNQIHPALWSDLFRTIMLWKYGGTYIDVDDICIRPLPTNIKNILPSCAIEDKYEEKEYNGGISSNHFGYKWRFGIDPIINIEKGNLFLLEMIKKFPTENPANWGQLLPTKIFKSDIEKWSKYITPIEWSDILYHPKHDGHTNFDKRYDGPKIKWDNKATDSKIETLLKNYNFSLVKNHHFSSESSDTVLASLINKNYLRKIGFITVVSSSDYISGASALIKSKNYYMDKKLPFICICQGLTIENIKELEDMGYIIIIVPGFVDTFKISSQLNINGKYKFTFDKLWIWNICDFETLVYLDADTMINNDIMNLFDKAKDDKVCAVIQKDGAIGEINTGVMVIKPSKQIFMQMIQTISDNMKIKGNNWGDQEFLSIFWKNKIIELEPIYNCLKADHDAKKKRQTCKILHWNGQEKPWHKGRKGVVGSKGSSYEKFS